MSDIMNFIANYLWLGITAGVILWIAKKVTKGVEELPVQEKKELKFNDYLTFRFEKRYKSQNVLSVIVLLTRFDGLRKDCEKEFEPLKIFTLEYKCQEGSTMNIEHMYNTYLRLFQELKKSNEYETIDPKLRSKMLIPLAYGNSNFSLIVHLSNSNDIIEEFCINNFKKEKWFAVHRVNDGVILNVFDDCANEINLDKDKENVMPPTTIIMEM